MSENVSDTSSFRRQMAGGAMIVAPLLFVVAEVLHARLETDPAKQLEAVAENTGRWYAAHALILVALALAVPAFFGLVHLFGRSRVLLGRVSLVIFVPGLVALAAIVGMELALWQMAQPASNREEMVALAERLNESAGTASVFLVVLLVPIAWLLAGIGLYLARVTPVWVAALIAISQPIGFASELGGGPKALAVSAQVAFAIGLVFVGIRTLKQSNADWEQKAAVDPTPATA